MSISAQVTSITVSYGHIVRGGGPEIPAGKSLFEPHMNRLDRLLKLTFM